jgi:hypothetical protein
MSGSYPLTERPMNANLSGFAPTRVSTAHSLQRQARSRGSHRWFLQLKYGPMIRATADNIAGFLDEQDGQLEKFMIIVPGKESPRGAVSGANVKVNGAHAVGLRSISIKGLPVSTNNVFMRRDIITFASHLKVYGITRDTNSSAGGIATIYLSSPLMTALADNEVVTWQNVAMQVAKVTDTVDRDTKGGLVCPGFDVNLIEDPL